MFFYIFFNLKLSSIKCNIFSNALFFYSIRIVFKWLIRAFSGHLPPEELLILWDLVKKKCFRFYWKKFDIKNDIQISDPRLWQLGNNTIFSDYYFKFSQRKFDASEHNRKYWSGIGWFIIFKNSTTHTAHTVTEKLNFFIRPNVILLK